MTSPERRRRAQVRFLRAALVALVLLPSLPLRAAPPGAGPAAAAPIPTALPQLTISFLVDPANEPSYVCLVTRKAPPLESHPIAVASLLGRETAADQIIRLRLGNLDPEALREQPALAAVAQVARRREEDARKRTTCEAEGPSCLPELFVNEGPARHNFVLCTDNRDGTAGARGQGGATHHGTVVIDLDFFLPPEQSPRVKSIALNGTDASLAIEEMRDPGKGADKDRAPGSYRRPLSISVRGGDYAATMSGVSAGGKVTLRLLPKCQKHEVELPPLELPESPLVTAGVSIGGLPELESCLVPRGAGRRFSLNLPYVEPGNTKTLEVHVTPFGAAHADAEFRTRWTDIEPPSVVRPRAVATSFSWQRDCMYPGEGDGKECPDAKIVGTGLACVGRRDEDVCQYRCEDARDTIATEFEFPARVRLTHDVNEAWELELSHTNQQLAGYIPLADRRVEVDLDDWGPANEKGIYDVTSKAAARIHYIVVHDSAGKLHRVAARGGQRIPLPGARCHDIVAYQLEGDREYDDGHVEIEGGRLRLPDPLEHVKQLIGGFALGVGMAFGSKPGADPQVLRNNGYSGPLLRPYALARLDLDLRPRRSPLTMSLRGTYMFGGKAYYPNDPNVASLNVPFSRFALEGAVSGHISVGSVGARDNDTWGKELGYLTLGGGGGYLGEGALLSADKRRAGAVFHTVTGSFFARYFVSRWIAVELLFRWVPEQMVTVLADYRGDAVPTPRLAHTFFFDLSMRYGR
jgi:hypothetical protein